MLGIAAIRSTSDTSVERSQGGAYSLMKSAVRKASGNATTSATRATVDRADQDRGDADAVELGLPLGPGEEAEAVVMQRRDGLVAEEQPDRAGEHQDEEADGSGHARGTTLSVAVCPGSIVRGTSGTPAPAGGGRSRIGGHPNRPCT